MEQFFHKVYSNFKKYNDNINTNYYNKDKLFINYYNPLINYKLGKLVSDKGYFSKVYDVIDLDKNNKYVMKISNPKDMTSLNEINILSTLKHKHIVKLKDTYLYKDRYYLILQKAYGGNLHNYLKRNIISERYGKKILRQLSDAIEYIHNQFIIIKDIKLDNVLLIDREYESDVMLCDFNLSVMLAQDYQFTCDRGGTLDYVAPEVIVSQKSYSFKSDIWSLGVLLFYCLGRVLPFYDDDNSVVLKNIAYGKYNFETKYWLTISDDAKDIIKNMLITDVYKRYNINDIKQHKWYV